MSNTLPWSMAISPRRWKRRPTPWKPFSAAAIDPASTPSCQPIVAAARALAFIFEAKLNRQTIRRTIGDVRAWTLEDARAEARRLQTLIDQGTDPRELDREWEEAKTAAKAAQEAAKSEAATRSAFKCHVFTHPQIADAPAKEVTAHQLAALVRKVREAGKERAAGILRSYLSAAFNAGKRAPFESALPADLILFGIEHNPVDAIPAIAVQRGDRTLSADELRAYVTALGDDLPDMALRLALLAGGQRMAQLLRARVGDYDPDTATLRLWDGKGKRQSAREHFLPLAPRAAALVAGLVQRAKGKDSPWLFSTHGKVAVTETTLGKRAAEISAVMGGEPFDLRDIRRTCETMLAGMGISRDTRAQLLSHGISGVQAAHYDRHAYTNEKRAALVAWEARLAEIQTGKPAAANVVELHPSAA